MTNKWEKVRTLLFGTGMKKVPLSKLGRELDISYKTMRRYYKYPNVIPVGRLLDICDTVGVEREDLREVLCGQ